MSVVYFCARCYGQLSFCEDPYCWDVLHHDGNCASRVCDGDVKELDLSGYLIFDYYAYAEAVAEVEGYEEYTRFMYRYWGIK